MSRSWTKMGRSSVATGCAMVLLLGPGRISAQDAIPPAPAKPAAPAATPAAAATTEAEEPKLTSDQLDALVSPIALYPDSLLAQALVASTYPLEIVQLQQWLVKNKSLTGTALTDAAAKQPWDPSIQSMAAIPDLVKRLADDIQWTTELGNAFLAQQSDVMDAVQRMRKKATDKGTLKSGEQQVVETKVVEEKTVIVIEQANPEVIYVPSYNPTVVYGPPPVYYSYPPVYYPPYTPGAAFFSFSVGVAVGAAFWGGGCGWGHNDIHVDIDRNVNRNTNRNVDRNTSGNRAGANATGRSGGGSTWKHDSSHRGAAPYSSKSTANKFSGSAASSRAQSGTGGNRVSSAQQSLGASSRSAGTSSFSGSGASRSGGPGASATSRSGGAGGANRSASASAGGNRMAGRDMPSASASRSSGFSGGSSGFSASGTRASSSRGASSMGGSRGGGGGRRR